jgi:hypothetical protein
MLWKREEESVEVKLEEKRLETGDGWIRRTSSPLMFEKDWI